MSLFGRVSAVCAPPKSKKVCQPTNRRGARKPPRRSPGPTSGSARRARPPGSRRSARRTACRRVAGEVGPVRRPDHAVPEPVGRARELHRDVRRAVGRVPAVLRAVRQDLVDQVWPTNVGQHLVDHQPLVVPGRLAPGREEGVDRLSAGPCGPRPRRCCGTSGTPRAARDDQVAVVADVAMTAEPSARRGTSSNRPPDSTPQLDRVGRVVQLGLDDRPAAVDRVEVEPRGPAVRRGRGFGLRRRASTSRRR